MGLADTAMLGHLDNPLYLGAVAVGANLLALFYWMFAFLRMSTTALTGQAYGAGSNSLITLQLLQGAGLALILSALLLALQSLILPLGLFVMADDPELRAFSLAYCEIRIYSAPAVFLTYVLIGWLIGLQNTRLPLVITVVANLLNLFLDYLFIVEFAWAHRGAALATLIAEYSALFIAVLGICKYHRQHLALNYTLRALWNKLKPLGFLALNTNLFIRTTILLLVFNFVIMQSARQGEVILAVNAIMMQLMLFVAFALDGYAHAAESMVAQAIGARSVLRFFKASMATVLPAIVISLCIALGFYFFRDALIYIMSDHLSIQESTQGYFFWLYLLPLVSVGCYMLDGIFIGASQTRLMLITMIISVVFIFFPCWWLLKDFKNHGLWAAFTLFNFSRTSLMTLAYYSLSRKGLWINRLDLAA